VPLLRAQCVLLCLFLSCSSDKAEDTGTEDQQYCESSVDLQFPDGSWATFDGCNNVLADATFEFDPDDPPEIRSFKFQLTGLDEPGFECWLIITSTGICGPGFYDVGANHSSDVRFEIQDCPFVPDDFEGAYTAHDGILLLETVSAGDTPGNFTGERIMTRLQGSIEATAVSGVQANVSFDLAVRIRGEDAEETECDRAE